MTRGLRRHELAGAQIVAGAFGGYFAGLVAYSGTVLLLGPLSGTDMLGVAFWGALAWFLVGCPLNFLLLVAVGALWRRAVGRTPGPVARAAALVLSWFVPTLVIEVAFGGGVRALASPEAMLFLAFFGCSAAVFAVVAGRGWDAARAGWRG